MHTQAPLKKEKKSKGKERGRNRWMVCVIKTNNSSEIISWGRWKDTQFCKFNTITSPATLSDWFCCSLVNQTSVYLCQKTIGVEVLCMLMKSCLIGIRTKQRVHRLIQDGELRYHSRYCLPNHVLWHWAHSQLMPLLLGCLGAVWGEQENMPGSPFYGRAQRAGEGCDVDWDFQNSDF